jgi:hypothetical protein
MKAVQSPVGAFIRVLSLSNSPLVGEGAKVLSQVLRDSSPPLGELILDNVHLTLPQLAELSLACVESRALSRVSFARNDLHAEAGLPLAQLIRRSTRLKYLNVAGNQMRAKGILDLIVAARDREITRNKSKDEESVMLEVSNMNVVVTFNRSVTGGASKDASGITGLEEQFQTSDVMLTKVSSAASLESVREFQLIVCDNTLSANETAVLILTDLKETAVIGVPETVTYKNACLYIFFTHIFGFVRKAATFTGSDESSVVTGFKVRLVMCFGLLLIRLFVVVGARPTRGSLGHETTSFESFGFKRRRSGSSDAVDDGRSTHAGASDCFCEAAFGAHCVQQGQQTRREIHFSHLSFIHISLFLSL